MSIQTRREKLAAKRAALNEEIKKIDVQIRAQKKAKARKDDTRRKILVGATVLAVINKKGPESKTRAWLAHELDKHVKKPKDRELLKDLLIENVKI